MPLKTMPEISVTSRELRDRVIRARPALEAAATSAGVSNLAVVGSVARGTASDGSDIDVLCDAADVVTLFDLAALRARFQALLGAPVDLIERTGHDVGLEHLEREAIPLWALTRS